MRNNESYRKIAIGIFLRIGTNMMWYKAHKNEKHVDMSWPVCVAQSIVALEQYNGSDIDSVSNSRVVRSKWRVLRSQGDTSKSQKSQRLWQLVRCMPEGH